MKHIYTITQIEKRNGIKKHLSKVGFLSVIGISKSDIYDRVMSGEKYETDSYIYLKRMSL